MTSFWRYEVSRDLLGAVKPRVTQALSGDNMTDAVVAVTAVVLAVLAVRAIRAAHLAPITHERNAVITVIFKLSGMSHGHYHSVEKEIRVATTLGGSIF